MMQRIRFLTAKQIYSFRPKTDDFGSSRNHIHDSILPSGSFNPFTGIVFPKLTTDVNLAEIFDEKAVIPPGSLSAYDYSTKTFYRRHRRPRRMGMHAAEVPPPVTCTDEEPTPENAEELLKYDDSLGKKEREVTARLAVRKLMSLHFHANKTAKIENELAKNEDLSLTTRFLSERQRLKEANATAALMSGSAPIPSSSGVIMNAANYSSVVSRRVRRAEDIKARRALRADGGGRTKGAFVATPENTASLLKEEHKSVEEPDWADLGARGRSLDDILSTGQTQSATEEDVDKEWADADVSTFVSCSSTDEPQTDDVESEYEVELEDARLGEAKKKQKRKPSHFATKSKARGSKRA